MVMRMLTRFVVDCFAWESVLFACVSICIMHKLWCQCLRGEEMRGRKLTNWLRIETVHTRADVNQAIGSAAAAAAAAEERWQRQGDRKKHCIMMNRKAEGSCFASVQASSPAVSKLIFLVLSPLVRLSSSTVVSIDWSPSDPSPASMLTHCFFLFFLHLARVCVNHHHHYRALQHSKHPIRAYCLLPWHDLVLVVYSLFFATLSVWELYSGLEDVSLQIKIELMICGVQLLLLYSKAVCVYVCWR